FHQLCDTHSAEVTVHAVAHRHGAGALLFLADDQHVRDFLQLGLADLVADLLRSIIASDAETVRAQLVFDALAIFTKALADRHHTRLLRSQPQRKRAGEMLDENAHKALHRAERSAMNHHRT